VAINSCFQDDDLVRRRCSSDWLAGNISVLRTVFDKIGGLAVMQGFVTPKRATRLPEILSIEEVKRILQAATTLRDQLLLGLMYGCGLKVGEACALVWGDVHVGDGTLCVRYARGLRVRELRIPMELHPILAEGVRRCDPDDYVFRGACEESHLTTRAAGAIVRKTAEASGVLKVVTGTTLRNTFAAHSLEGGATFREVQEMLGHEQVETTMIHLQCMRPSDTALPVSTPEEGGVFGDSLLSDVEGATVLDLPFHTEDASPAASFYRALKMQIAKGFLALRGILRRRGPPGSDTGVRKSATEILRRKTDDGPFCLPRSRISSSSPAKTPRARTLPRITRF